MYVKFLVRVRVVTDAEMLELAIGLWLAVRVGVQVNGYYLLVF